MLAAQGLQPVDLGVPVFPGQWLAQCGNICANITVNKDQTAKFRQTVKFSDLLDIEEVRVRRPLKNLCKKPLIDVILPLSLSRSPPLAH